MPQWSIIHQATSRGKQQTYYSINPLENFTFQLKDSVVIKNLYYNRMNIPIAHIPGRSRYHQQIYILQVSASKKFNTSFSKVFQTHYEEEQIVLQLLQDLPWHRLNCHKRNSKVSLNNTPKMVMVSFLSYFKLTFKLPSREKKIPSKWF